MSLSARIRRAGPPLSVLVLTGCLMEPMPDCTYTDCGTEAGTITSVAPDGSVRWSATLQDSADFTSRGDPAAPPVVLARGGSVVVDGCRAVHVLDAADGRVVLETESMDRVWTVTEDLVVGSGGDGVTNWAGPDARGLLALPLAGADPSWVRLPLGDRVVQGVVEVREGLAVLSGDLVHVLRPDGPTTLVTLGEPVSAPVGSAPALVRVDDHTVAVLHDDGAVEAVDTTRGRSVWTVGPPDPARTARAGHLGDDLVLSWGTSTGGEVARVTADGTVTWRAEGALPGRVVLDPAATVVPVQKQYLDAVDATTGESLSLAAGPRPANDVPVLSGPHAVGWTAAGIGTTSAWSAAAPTGDPLWRRQGVVVGASADEVVLLTGRSAPRSLTAVSPVGTDAWHVPVRHDGLSVTAVPSMGTVVSDLAVERVRAEDCDDYPTRHTVPAGALG